VLAGGVDPVFPKLGKVKLHGSAPKITSYGLPCLKSNWVGQAYIGRLNTRQTGLRSE